MDISLRNTHGKCSSSLIIREIQSKKTIRYHLTPVKHLSKKKSQQPWNNLCWWACDETETFTFYWWESCVVQSLCLTLWRVLRKVR